MNRRIAASMAGAAALLFAQGAAAELRESVTAAELKSILEAAGMNPTLLADQTTGAPVAIGKAGEVEFVVRALDCSGTPAACENLLFFANFRLGRALTVRDYQIVNWFNESQVFGRAYVIPARNEVGVDYVIELGGGVAKTHLEQNVQRWTDVIGAFIAKFTAGQSDS